MSHTNEDSITRMNNNTGKYRPIRRTNALVSLGAAIGIVVVIFLLRRAMYPTYQIFWILVSVNFGYLAFKLLSSLLYRPIVPSGGSSSASRPSISAIIPCYNEPVDSLERLLTSLHDQTVLVDEIIFVDDGSETDECFRFVSDYFSQDIAITAHRFERNQGKKACILWASERAKGDLLLMTDSDGVLASDAIEQISQPFIDPKVGSVSGRIMVKNYSDSVVTRIQEVVYFNAFEVGRAAQSVYKDVIVASGALSMHRKEILDQAGRETFAKERFFGIRCEQGDDRLLTDISKERGFRTVYQNNALCYTTVPNSLRLYFLQQVRWLKSAYLFSVYTIRHSWNKPLLTLFQLLESYLWLFNLVLVGIAFFISPITISVALVLTWIAYSVLVSLFGSVRLRQLGMGVYLMSIFYMFLYTPLLIAMRLYALVTIGRSGWFTR